MDEVPLYVCLTRLGLTNMRRPEVNSPGAGANPSTLQICQLVQAVVTGTLVRRMVEDPLALQSSMQTEIRSIFAVLSQRVAVAGGARLPQV